MQRGSRGTTDQQRQVEAAPFHLFGHMDHFIERRWQLAQVGEPGWENNIRLEGGKDVGLTIHGSGYVKADDHVGQDIDSFDDVPTSDLPSGADHDLGWLERVDSERLGAFAARKQYQPNKCQKCRWKRFCYGGCPKHRQHGGEQPEPTALCEGYIRFYDHAMDRVEWLANHLRQGRQPPSPKAAKPGRNKRRGTRV